jgi:hypothetical protein
MAKTMKNTKCGGIQTSLYSNKTKTLKMLLDSKRKKGKIFRYIAYQEQNEKLFNKLLREIRMANKKKHKNPLKNKFLPKLNVVYIDIEEYEKIAKLPKKQDVSVEIKTLFNSFIVDYQIQEVEGVQKLSLLVEAEKNLSPILEESNYSDTKSPSKTK